MKFIDKKTIESCKEINGLDKLVFKFIKILEKYTDYVIISGYVSILLGRSRSTEDIDLFIKPIDKEKFSQLYKNLKKAGFWCLNAEDVNEVYSYLTKESAIRFAENQKVIPNFEVKPIKNFLDAQSFNDMITVKTKIGRLNISSLERQIAFKRYYLGTDKDIEDAKHIETTFKEKINKSVVERYKKDIESFKKNEKTKNL